MKRILTILFATMTLVACDDDNESFNASRHWVASRTDIIEYDATNQILDDFSIGKHNLTMGGIGAGFFMTDKMAVHYKILPYNGEGISETHNYYMANYEFRPSECAFLFGNETFSMPEYTDSYFVLTLEKTYKDSDGNTRRRVEKTRYEKGSSNESWDAFRQLYDFEQLATSNMGYYFSE